jgi:hypothetical protein
MQLQASIRMVVKALEIKLWKSGIFVSAVSMPRIEWLSQSIGFLMQKLIQKEKWRANGRMHGAISAKFPIMRQFRYPALLVSDKAVQFPYGESHEPVLFPLIKFISAAPALGAAPNGRQ